jgi:hypothetical protein
MGLVSPKPLFPLGYAKCRFYMCNFIQKKQFRSNFDYIYIYIYINLLGLTSLNKYEKIIMLNHTIYLDFIPLSFTNLKS